MEVALWFLVLLVLAGVVYRVLEKIATILVDLFPARFPPPAQKDKE